MKKLFTLLLVLGSFSLVGCGGSSPGDSVKDLAYAMEKGDADGVKEVFPGMHALIGNDKYEEMIKEAAADAKKKGGIKSVTIDKEEIDGDTATVTSTLVWNNGEEETQDFKLEKDDGKWVIIMDAGDGKETNANSEVDFDFPTDEE